MDMLQNRNGKWKKQCIRKKQQQKTKRLIGREDFGILKKKKKNIMRNYM